MPITAYATDEVTELIRLAWATGVRDALISLQGRTLDDAQRTRCANCWRTRAGCVR